MKLITLLAALAVLVCASAAQALRVVVNDEEVLFRGTPPQRIDGRVFVPLRGVLEELGAEIEWNSSLQRVRARRGDTTIELRIGERDALVNGRDVRLEAPAQSIGGSTMVPLRFMAEALGADVRYDGATRTVSIRTDGGAGSGSGGSGSGGSGSGSGGTGSLRIRSFSHSGEGWLREGSRVRFTLSGTQDGEAAFQLSGITRELRMEEVSDGRYEREWTVPSGQEEAIASAEVVALGKLTLGQQQQLIQAGSLLRIDNLAPRVQDTTPADNETVATRRPVVSAILSDEGSGIAADSVRVSVNGRDVTKQSTITRSLVAYTPEADLPTGSNEVRVQVADAAGNRTTLVWDFTVRANATTGTGIRGATISATAAVAPGTDVAIAMDGLPGGKATFAIVGSNVTGNLREASPGRYRGSYRVTANDAFANATVRVTLTMPDGRSFTADANRKLSVRRETGPTIEEPKADASVSDELVVRGTAAPGSTLRLRITYTGRALGAIELRGTLNEQTIEVDSRGRWQSRPVRTGVFGARDVVYTITVVEVLEDGKTGKSATVRVRD